MQGLQKTIKREHRDSGNETKQKDEWVRGWSKKKFKDSEMDESQGMFN